MLESRTLLIEILILAEMMVLISFVHKDVDADLSDDQFNMTMFQLLS